MRMITCNTSINKKKIVGYFLCALFWAYIISAIVLKVWYVFSYSNPKEYREMTSVAFAFMFSKGQNPYSIELLNGERPIITNAYGLLAPIIWSIFIRAFSWTGLSVLQICEGITLIIEIVSIIVFYKLIYLKTNNKALGLFGALFFEACFWRYSAFGGAFPDQIGVSLSVLLVFMIEKDLSQARLRIWRYILIVVCMFYVKQYFVFISIGILLFLLINGYTKEAIKYVIGGLITGLASVIIINMIFPLYFTETMAIAQCGLTMGDWWFSIRQIIWLSRTPFMVFSLAIILFIIYMVVKKVKHENAAVIGGACMLKKSVSFFIFVFVFPIVIGLAKNDGTYYTYYLQLWYPYFIAVGCEMFCEISNKEYNFSRILKNIIVIAFIAVVIKSMMYLKSYIIVDTEIRSKQDGWAITKETLSGYLNEDEALLMAPISYLCLEKDIYTDDYGQAEFNDYYSLENYEKNRLWKKLFPYAEVIINKNIEYRNIISQSILDGRYSCVVANSGSYIDGILKNSDSAYNKVNDVVLSTGSQDIEASIWILNN